MPQVHSGAHGKSEEHGSGRWNGHLAGGSKANDRVHAVAQEMDGADFLSRVLLWRFRDICFQKYLFCVFVTLGISMLFFHQIVLAREKDVSFRLPNCKIGTVHVLQLAHTYLPQYPNVT